MEKFEGALGKGKGRKLYAYKVLMTKVGNHRLVLFIKTGNIVVIFFPLIYFVEMDEVSTGL